MLVFFSKAQHKKELGEKDRFSNSLKYYKKEVAKLDERKLKMYDKWLDGEIDDDAKDLWERRNRSEI
ncbi:hypothetical protein N9M92_06140, partial [Flavobacteriaceae bacterium]|nr:hypothetical protein [Flavobacteriaceae bacterium]